MIPYSVCLSLSDLFHLAMSCKSIHVAANRKMLFFLYGWVVLHFTHTHTYTPVCVCVCACAVSCLSHVWLFAALQTVASQAPLSMGFSKAAIQEWAALVSSRGIFIYIYVYTSLLLFLILISLNYESIIIHLQETWKTQNKATYSSTVYYNSFSWEFQYPTLKN